MRTTREADDDRMRSLRSNAAPVRSRAQWPHHVVLLVGALLIVLGISRLAAPFGIGDLWGMTVGMSTLAGIAALGIAVLLLRPRTRAVGVMLGAAAFAGAAFQMLLSARFGLMLLPALLVVVLVATATRLDRQGGGSHG